MSRLLVVSLFLSAVPMTDRPYAKELQALFKTVKQPESKGPPPGVLWSMRVSPAFPMTWPGPTALRRYAFAGGFDPNLRDGERVAAPFAFVEFTAKGSTIKQTSTALSLLGTQGIEPISKAQAAVVQSIDEADAALLAGKLESVRAGYCAWISYNGVLAAHLRPSHDAFFKALDCS